MSDTCRTCHQTHPWEDGTTPHHPFNDGSLFGAAVLTPPKEVKVEESPWPFDPVLRQALIDAGILTPQQLRDAEAKIRAISNIFDEGVKT